MSLRVKDLSFSYAKRDVLFDVSFEAQRGELVAVLGPNGSGKSTLLRCLDGILRPKAGEITLDERDLLGMSSHDRAKLVGFIPQYASTGRVRVFDSVLLGRKPHMGFGASKRDLEITEAAISNVGLQDFRLRMLDEMSGGEAQKAAVARALAQEPQLLLMDEPTSSLDLKNQMEVMALISHIVYSHNMTGLVTMHDLNSAFRYASKFVFLKKGRVQSICTHDELCEDLISDVYETKIKLLETDYGYVAVALQKKH